MIAHLRGSIAKTEPGIVDVDVAGVGYRVAVPLSAWDDLREGQSATLWVSTYVREDRLELFGFLEKQTRGLFEELIARQGIGPKLGLELCDVPQALLVHAMQTDDEKFLMTIKGIGRRTAEKLLIELKSLAEKHPEYFAPVESAGNRSSPYDADAVAALTQLGYGTADVLLALERLPRSLQSTEERVTAALRTL